MTKTDITLDLLQYQVISAIFSRSIGHELALKGGFALRALFGSERSTKDIDLQQDGREYDLRRLQKIMRASIKDALNTGLLKEISITEPKQTDTVARWKIIGKTNNRSGIHLTIEVSRRGMPPANYLTIRPFADPSKSRISPLVLTYNQDALIASKIYAFLSETRMAARDLYDIDILIRMKAVPPAEMIQSLKKKGVVEKIYRKLEMITWEIFRADVLPYLPEGAASRFTEKVFEEMRLIAGETLSKWLIPSVPDNKTNHSRQL